MPSLALCTHTLRPGRTCGQPRLRGKSHCRFHVPSYAQLEHERRMDHLCEELEVMKLPQLLEILHRNLEGIEYILRGYPEVKLTLLAVIDRLDDLSQTESMIREQLQQNQGSSFDPTTAAR
jgi:hypothetical protein